MSRVLFVSNGHGEAAIADRIALEVRALAPGIALDHLALVGDGASEQMTDVGPARSMPSGGLIAMGNLRNIARDVASGLIRLTLEQWRFLRASRGRYAVAVAVGDVYALAMSALGAAPRVFVGTAKSVSVSPYGALEERLLRGAAACFVRDDATARRLAEHGVRADAANVIVDLFTPCDDPGASAATAGFEPVLALFPGSRATAYEHAAFLLEVVRAAARSRPALGGVLSVARGLDAGRFAAVAEAAGWSVDRRRDGPIPFVLADGGRERVRAWSGPLGAVLHRAGVVLGQAGTANEAAAAAGIPVVAFESARGSKTAWYRQRQRGLLGDALAVLPARAGDAVAGVNELLGDPARRAHMAAEGRRRMGPAGGARRIAGRIVAVAGIAG